MAFNPDEFLAEPAKEETKTEVAESGFNPDAFLAEGKPEVQAAPVKAEGPVAPAPGSAEFAGAISPAVMGYGMGPTGMGQLTADTLRAGTPLAQSVMQGGRNIANVYKASPIMAPLADIIGMSTMGVPPVAAAQGAMGAYEKWKALEAAKNVASQVLSQGAPTTTPVTGAPTTETIRPFGEMRTAAGANTELGLKLKNLYESSGGNNAVRTFLNSAEGKAAMAANPELAAKAAAYLQAVPGYGTQAMRVAAPILKGAARVAGPVGLGYDLYQAGQLARETQLGERLAQGQGAQAAQAYRNMLNQNISGYQVKPDEAANLLASGDERTINIYGGRARLNEIVQGAVRGQAAKRALQPIAPTQLGQ